METVFVLVAVYDHESSATVGVYATRQAAEKEKTRLHKRIQQRLDWAKQYDGTGKYRCFGAHQYADGFVIEKHKVK